MRRVNRSAGEPVQGPDATWPVRSGGAASVGRMEWLRCRYTHYGLDKLNTKEHQAMALRAAREGIALLKNQNDFLPLSLKDKQWAFCFSN